MTLGATTPATATDKHRKIEPELALAIKEQLEAEGYEIRRLKRDDGMIEAYVLKDGQRFEIYLDYQAQIVRINRK